MQKRFLFIVQGEGRGHLTQAITLSEMLRQAGHQVAAVLVGRSRQREIPAFFYDKIQAAVVPFQSPNFIFDQQKKSVKIGATLSYNLRHYRVFLQSLKEIHQQVDQHQPDVIINFYDLLGGLYYFFYKPNIPLVCIGHQYLLQHPAFEFPKRSWLNRLILNSNTMATSLGADKKLALSFRPMPDDARQNIVVTPPLLRSEVVTLRQTGQAPPKEPYFLAYLNHNGFSEEVIAWHRRNPTVKIHCFWDRRDAAEEVRYHENLIFHRINDRKFLELMRDCTGYVCTAGFESVCEAMYLGKPVMIIPVHGHFEQVCNALDALRAKAGIAADHFDFSRFIEYLPQYQSTQEPTSQWVSQASTIFIRELEAVCTQATPQKTYRPAFRYTGSLLKYLALE